MSLTSDLVTGSQNFERETFLVFRALRRRRATMIKFWNPRKEHRQLPETIDLRALGHFYSILEG